MIKYKILSSISLLFWLLLIIILSSQNGTDTAQTSYKISSFVSKLFYNNANISDIKSVDFVIRKIAHIVLFFGLGFSITLFGFAFFIEMIDFKFLVLISVVLSVLTAFLDEWRKQFIVGRHFDIYESMINIGSAIVGVAFMYLFHKFFSGE
ncbi:MAG: VanZ family protein [Clostridia bacterium]